MSEILISATRALLCDCIAGGDRRIEPHTDTCRLWDCDACAAKIQAGQEHTPDCSDRCPACGSEGRDLDHRDGCPTLGTCAQTHPNIPREQGWHYDPPFTPEQNGRGEWGRWIDHHMATVHPDVPRY